MDVGIRRGFKLAGQKPAVLFGQFDSLHVHARAFLSARGQHHLCAQHPHQPAPLNRKAVGYRHDQWLAFLRANHCEPDASVAAGRLHYSLPWLQGAVALCSFDDVQRQTILD